MTAQRELVLIDGRSGSGKTELSRRIAHECGYPVVSLDWIYPGWDGLDAGASAGLREVVIPWSRGEDSRVALWDWSARRYRGVLDVPADGGLIVEGCGSLTAESVRLATRAIWIDADATERRHRALGRDGQDYAPHWQRWALQEERFIALHRSPELATETLVT